MSHIENFDNNHIIKDQGAGLTFRCLSCSFNGILFNCNKWFNQAFYVLIFILRNRTLSMKTNILQKKEYSVCILGEVFSIKTLLPT